MALSIGTVIYVPQGVALWDWGERAVLLGGGTGRDGTVPKSGNVRIINRWPQSGITESTPPSEIAYALQATDLTYAWGWVRGDKIYVPPRLSKFDVRRMGDTSISVNANGTYVRGSITSITFTIQYKLKTSGSFINIHTGSMTLGDTTWTMPARTIGVSGESSYDIRLLIEDGVGARQVFDQSIGTSGFPLTIGDNVGDGIGVNAMFETGGADLQIGSGGLSIDGVTLTKSELIALKALL